MLFLPAVSYYIIFHSDIQSQINATQANNQNLEQELLAAERATKTYRKDLEELRERERRKAELSKVLPVTTEYPAFLASVQNVANLVGVELVAWTPQDEVPEEFYAKVPMRIELSGRYHRLAKFFHNVGQVERIINMENIILHKPEVIDGEVQLKAQVMATAFHALEEGRDQAATGTRTRRNRSQ